MINHARKPIRNQNTSKHEFDFCLESKTLTLLCHFESDRALKGGEGSPFGPMVRSSHGPSSIVSILRLFRLESSGDCQHGQDLIRCASRAEATPANPVACAFLTRTVHSKVNYPDVSV